MYLYICVFTEKTQSRQYSQQEEDNRYQLRVDDVAAVNQQSVRFSMTVLVSVRVGFVFLSWLSK